MDTPPEPSRRVTIEALKASDPQLLSSLTYILRSTTDSSLLLPNEPKDITGDSASIEVLADSLPQGSVLLNLSQDTDAWLTISEALSLKVSVHSLPRFQSKRPLIHGLTKPSPSPCDYIRRLQEIEEKEREISTMLAQSRIKAPSAYKEYLDSSPRSTKRSPLKKKTLETDNFADFDPDFTFNSFFDVALENIASTEAALLEHASVGMLNKLRSLKFDVEEYELTEEVIQEFESPMKTLTDSVEESKDQFLVEQQKMNEFIENIKAEIGHTARMEQETDKKNQAILREIERLKNEISQQREENAKARSEEGMSESQLLRAELERVLRDIQELEHDYSQASLEFAKKYPEQELAIAVNEKILKLSELHKMTNNRDAAMQEGVQLKAELLQLEGELEVQNDRESAIAWHKDQQSSYEKNSKHVGLQLKEIEGQTEANLYKSEQNLERVKGSIIPLNESNKGCEFLLSEKNAKISELADALAEMRKNNAQLDLILEKEKEIIDEYAGLQQAYLNGSLVQKAVINELENLSNSLLKVSENSITAKRLLRRAEEMIEEQDLQHVSMCKLIALIKETKPAYIAVQNDSTDMALAKYLNSRHKTLDINFKRTEKDKYTFGSVKIEMKLEDGLVVFVSGKKVTIEEFLEAYLPIEKEKTIKRSGSKPLDKREERKEMKPPAKVGKSPTTPISASLKKTK